MTLSRFAFLLTLGLVLAGIVHLASILLIPRLAGRDAYARVLSLALREAAFVPVPAPLPGETVFPFSDPAATLMVCPFDLARGPVRIRVPVGEPFLSLSLHSKGGGVFFAMTDRSANRGLIDMLVMTQAQRDALIRSADEDQPVRKLRVVSPVQSGFAALRVVASLPSQRPAAATLALRATCAHEAPGGAASP